MVKAKSRVGRATSRVIYEFVGGEGKIEGGEGESEGGRQNRG